jgi:hypothetical protein
MVDQKKLTQDSTITAVHSIFMALKAATTTLMLKKNISIINKDIIFMKTVIVAQDKCVISDPINKRSTSD